MRNSIIVLAMASMPVFATDYSGDIHKNDYKWMQFNYMYAFDELPGESSHDYLEMEFGGRSGLFDLYGYVDVFNPTNNSKSDKNGKERIYASFSPRLSLDALTGNDLSFGPIKEVYLSSSVSVGGAGNVKGSTEFSTYGALVGLGSDVDVPWLGKIGLNLYAQYDINNKEWNGYQISTGWFKPFHFFDNGNFISYQGYADYVFGINDEFSELNSATGFAMFNGLYWHSDRFSIGYGLKLYDNVYGLRDGGLAGKTSGAGHYVSVGYKF